MPMQTVSIIAPVYNEEQGIQEFYKRSAMAVQGLPYRFSLTLVNDGSTDNTLAAISSLTPTAALPIRMIDLSRNFGHSNALTAGLEQTDSDICIMMDADLEDPPEIIPQLLAQYEQGKQVVYTVKTHREDTWFRKMAFYAFHFFFSRVTSLNIPEGSGSYSLMSRQFVRELTSLHEGNRFMPGLRAFVGFTPGYVYYRREARYAGVPKQTFFRLINLSLNAFFLFSNAPLWFLSLLMLSLGVGLALAIPSFDPSMRILAMALIGQTFMIWIIGVLSFKTFIETLKRPHYVVSRIYDIK